MFFQVLLPVLVFGWLAVQGADVGAGLLMPVLGRDRIVGAIGPLFLASEVWAVAALAVASLVGVAHRSYAGVVVVVCAWALRDAGLWFRCLGGGRGWDAAVFAGSFGLALGWGLLLGGGPVFLALAVMHGASFAALRAPAAVPVRRLATLPVAAMYVFAVPDTPLAAVVVILLVVAALRVPPVLAALATGAALGVTGLHLTGTAGAATPAVLAAVAAPVLPVLVFLQIALWRLCLRAERLSGPARLRAASELSTSGAGVTHDG